MKGKIDIRGNLFISRGKKEKEQSCPFDPVEAFCWDRCPHFSEPEIITDPKTGHNDGVSYVTRLELCHGKILYFDDFVDERKN